MICAIVTDAGYPVSSWHFSAPMIISWVMNEGMFSSGRSTLYLILSRSSMNLSDRLYSPEFTMSSAFALLLPLDGDAAGFLLPDVDGRL